MVNAGILSNLNPDVCGKCFYDVKRVFRIFKKHSVVNPYGVQSITEEEAQPGVDLVAEHLDFYANNSN